MGDKFLFKYVLEHLEFFHGNEMKQYDLVIGKALVTRKNTKRSQVNNGEHWNPGKIISSCGALFFQFVRIKNDTMYSCIVFMGSSDEARKYSYTCSVTSNMEETFMFKGPVFTVDRSFDDIIASGSLLMIRIDVVNRSLNEKKQLEFEITIRNLKEEAKDDDMESGVSDGE